MLQRVCVHACKRVYFRFFFLGTVLCGFCLVERGVPCSVDLLHHRRRRGQADVFLWLAG